MDAMGTKSELSENYYCESLIDTPDDGFQIRLFDQKIIEF